MEQVKVERFVAMEVSAPKRRFVRSDAALYVLMLVAVLGVITAANALSARFNWPRLIVQVTLYVVLLALGYVVYRKFLMAYRYTLTERMLSVDRIVGKKERSESSVHLSDITAIRPYAERRGEAGKLRSLFMGKRADTLAVTVVAAGSRETLLLSPSADFCGKLIAQWKIARQ